MHTSYFILIAAGIFWILSFTFLNLRQIGEGIKELKNSDVSAEATEKRYNKFNRLKKWFFYIGLILILTAAGVAIIPRLIEMNAMG